MFSLGLLLLFLFFLSSSSLLLLFFFSSSSDHQCYQFRVIEVIPSSFRSSENEEKSSNTSPNILISYLPYWYSFSQNFSYSNMHAIQSFNHFFFFLKSDKQILRDIFGICIKSHRDLKHSDLSFSADRECIYLPIPI